MLKSINKIPSGAFLVPMILSAFIYTFWPELLHVGCLTDATQSGLIGLLLVGVYYLYNLYQYPLDTNIEK